MVTPSLETISGTYNCTVDAPVQPSSTLKVSENITPPAVVPSEDGDANAKLPRPAAGTLKAHINVLSKMSVLHSAKYGFSASSHTGWISSCVGSYNTRKTPLVI